MLTNAVNRGLLNSTDIGETIMSFGEKLIWISDSEEQEEYLNLLERYDLGLVREVW
jgi:hypothetical protein